MKGVAAGVQYLALLRGVNVGGKNLVKMAELRAAVEEMGVADVATYIASGNLLFRAPRQKRDALAGRLESELSARFGLELKVVLLTESLLRGVVDGAPKGFGSATHRCDAIFLRKPLTVKRVMGIADPREGIDEVWAGKGVVYWARLASRASGSRLSRVAGMPEYKNMTIRSWSTTTKLLALMESRTAR